MLTGLLSMAFATCRLCSIVLFFLSSGRPHGCMWHAVLAAFEPCLKHNALLHYTPYPWCFVHKCRGSVRMDGMHTMLLAFTHLTGSTQPQQGVFWWVLLS